MNRLPSLCLVLALVAALAGCGGKPEESGSSTSAPAGGAATPAASATSKYDSGPRAGATAADAALAAQGAEMFKSKGCSACHAWGQKLTGPDLKGVSMRRTQVWLENQILHPDLMVKEDPIARELFAKHALQMPNQGLTAGQTAAVIEHFKKLDQDAGLTPASN
jgi:hypothetical protein